MISDARFRKRSASTLRTTNDAPLNSNQRAQRTRATHALVVFFEKESCNAHVDSNFVGRLEHALARVEWNAHQHARRFAKVFLILVALRCGVRRAKSAHRRAHKHTRATLSATYISAKCSRSSATCSSKATTRGYNDAHANASKSRNNETKRTNERTTMSAHL